MVEKTLHFLNGDSTKYIFDQTDIQGSVAVMRETFSFWPILPLDDPNFWKERRKYFQQYYFASEQGFNRRVLTELEKIKNPYEEIVIWYEYDTYCQMNMMFLVEWTRRHTNAHISLVYSAIGLGREQVADYPRLLNNRIRLVVQDIQAIRELFEMVRSSSFERIDWTKYPDLPNLKKSIVAFQAQFYPKNGKGCIQDSISTMLGTSAKSGREIIGELMKIDTIYGFGDLQYLILLAGMGDELEFIKPIANGDEYFEALLSTDFALKK